MYSAMASSVAISPFPIDAFSFISDSLCGEKDLLFSAVIKI